MLLWPPWTMVALKVLCSRGSSQRPESPSWSSDGVGLRGVEQAQQLRAFVGWQGFGEGLDHQAHAGGDVHWQAAPVEDLQGAAELGHGAAAQGHGAVSAGAAEDDLGAAAGLFGDLDGVVLVAVEEGRVAADLTDGVAHAC